MSLDVSVRQRLGAFQLDIAFRAEGGLTALFGRSGSGKTSLVNLVSGLTRPDEGRIAMGDRVLADTKTGLFVPAHRRRIGYVFQDARLFPHLTVRQNLVFGRWFAPRAERSADFDGVVDLLGLSSLLARRPQRLSGGEKQRVAIGRALLANPRLLLMDEPLAALDEARKAEIIPYIERLGDEAGVPILYVSHSVSEVRRLASHLVVLANGRVVANGPAAGVMDRLDLFPLAADQEPGRELDAEVVSHDPSYGLTTVALAGARFHLPTVAAPIGSPLRLRIRARDVMIATRAPEGISALNVARGRIVSVRPDGPSGMDLLLDCAGDEILARITRRSFDELGLHPGTKVYAVVKAVAFRPAGERPPAD
ncbi:molybdenum ABC transporter ATP-binding protein [Aureimonas ureilytica]|uniref:Molybdenum ABC transporter ATP-binding protein n=1 Tax=Aureimonas ureilytica TaxID=401562 RepID=A0A175RUP1_9HYPH|nr:molybdenum ABC transporter ATP-binding protein [Aureimonas ureilytica]KTR07420.1 molybdenum ABC transporter ATP-binding protein [Aureimonas ureilytica]